MATDSHTPGWICAMIQEEFHYSNMAFQRSSTKWRAAIGICGFDIC